MAELQCPKCQAPMRSYERSGVTVDRCTECGGMFLDRGELEHLIDAEGAYHEQASRSDERHQDKRRDDDDEHGGHGFGRRRRSFFGEMFGD